MASKPKIFISWPFAIFADCCHIYYGFGTEEHLFKFLGDHEWMSHSSLTLKSQGLDIIKVTNMKSSCVFLGCPNPKVDLGIQSSLIMGHWHFGVFFTTIHTGEREKGSSNLKYTFKITSCRRSCAVCDWAFACIHSASRPRQACAWNCAVHTLCPRGHLWGYCGCICCWPCTLPPQNWAPTPSLSFPLSEVQFLSSDI